MKVGFTGTQKGTTSKQIVELMDFFESNQISEFHHGDCIGADYQADLAGKSYDLPIILHPPTNPKKRAFCEGYSEIREEKPYLVRNRDIVDESDMLVACPGGPEEPRSGTWSTIRYAHKQGKEVLIFMPEEGDFVVIQGDKS